MKDYSILKGKVIKNIEEEDCGDIVIIHFTDGTSLKISDGSLSGGNLYIDYKEDNKKEV